MAYRHLTIERDGAVERVTLNRPDVRNALNDELIAELTAWAERAAGDPALRGVVLAGAGRTFSAGADVEWMAKTIAYGEEENLRDALALAHLFSTLDRLQVPIVGRVQGAALGGGAGLAAVCDIVVADEGAVFGFTEVKLGILPAVISPFVIAKIGQSAARALFLTGARFSALRAREIGLVHTVVPAAELDAAVAAHIGEVLTGSPEAIAASKRLIAEVAGRASEEVRELTARTIAAHRVSRHGQEGLRAFLEKRRASWTPADD
jgi:methylglutaconyl-CoA hydratase